MKRLLKIGLGLVAGSSILAAIVLNVALRDGPAAVPPAPLNASISAEGFVLIVKNEDHQDWRNVRLEVNHRYACHLDAIAMGTTDRVPLARCVDDDGARFNLFAMAPVDVVIYAVLVDDTGEASNHFVFEH